MESVTALIAVLREQGPWALAGALVLYFLRDHLRTLTKPADRTAPNELTAAFKENTEAMRLFVKHLQSNTDTVNEMRGQVGNILATMQMQTTHLAVLVEQGRGRR